MITKEEASEYHHRERHGKYRFVPPNLVSLKKDLSLPYASATQKNPDNVFKDTAKGNFVAVSNGTNGKAVWGLGDISPAAGKPLVVIKDCGR